MSLRKCCNGIECIAGKEHEDDFALNSRLVKIGYLDENNENWEEIVCKECNKDWIKLTINVEEQHKRLAIVGRVSDITAMTMNNLENRTFWDYPEWKVRK